MYTAVLLWGGQRSQMSLLQVSVLFQCNDTFTTASENGFSLCVLVALASGVWLKKKRELCVTITAAAQGFMLFPQYISTCSVSLLHFQNQAVKVCFIARVRNHRALR